MSGLDHSFNLQRFAQFFRPGFLGWLADNLHVYRAFESTAFDLVARGHDRLSARTIVHGLRHFTPCRETSELGWKINDHLSPDLARVYVILHPHSAPSWEFRRPDWRAFLAAVALAEERACA
jgi:hypothetical protein